MIVDTETAEIVTASPTPYQLMPGLTDEERASLRGDIEKNGIRVPIDVDENDNILDGHHRAWIAAELGIACPRRIVAGLTDEEKRAHAVAVNIMRRNLTRDQRRELVARLRRDGMSQRAIAESVGVDKDTVGRDLATVPNGDSSPDRIVGRDGKSRPAKAMDRLKEAAKKHPVSDARNTNAAIETRIAKAKELAASGHTSRQIMEMLGYNSMSGWIKFRRDHNIEVPADAVVGKGKLHDPNRIVTETVVALEGAVLGIGLVNPEELDRDQIATWATSLSDSLRSLNRFHKQLKEMAS